jgi:hypothetical protein
MKPILPTPTCTLPTEGANCLTCGHPMRLMLLESDESKRYDVRTYECDRCAQPESFLGPKPSLE